jgi:hypothetical protein
MATVWMKPPDGGEPKEVEGGSEELVRLMIAGWHQATPPQKAFAPQEVKDDAR